VSNTGGVGEKKKKKKVQMKFKKVAEPYQDKFHLIMTDAGL
jgi:hypothetical protein